MTRGLADAASEVVVSRPSGSLDAVYADLGSSFGMLAAEHDARFADVSYQMRQDSEDLRAIVEALREPLGTQGRELRRRAEEALAFGWYEDARVDFARAVEFNRYDFTAHQALGTLALLHGGSAEEAVEHFRAAAKYSEPKSETDHVIALLGAAMAADRAGRPKLARGFAREALDVDPECPEAQYAAAKYHVSAGGSLEEARANLRFALRERAALALLADVDPSFRGSHGPTLDELLWGRREEAAYEARREGCSLIDEIARIREAIGASPRFAVIEALCAEAEVDLDAAKTLIEANAILQAAEARALLARRRRRLDAKARAALDSIERDAPGGVPQISVVRSAV